MRKVASGDNISQESRVKKARRVDGAGREARIRSCTRTQQAGWAESRQRRSAENRQETGLMLGSATLVGPRAPREGNSTQHPLPTMTLGP